MAKIIILDEPKDVKTLSLEEQKELWSEELEILDIMKVRLNNSLDNYRKIVRHLQAGYKLQNEEKVESKVKYQDIK